MVKRIMFVWIVLTNILPLHAQQHFYREGSNSTVFFTQAEFDSVFQIRKEKNSTGKMYFWYRLNDPVRQGDSIVHTVTYHQGKKEIYEQRMKQDQWIGKNLPAFSFQNIQGDWIYSDSLRGKPVVINLWFTTCPPCVREMPELNRIKALPENTDVVFLSMTFESKDRVQKFLKKTEFTFNHIADVKSYCNKFTTAYPVTIFIDKNGVISVIMEGIREVPRMKDGQLSYVSDPSEFLRELSRIRN